MIDHKVSGAAAYAASLLTLPVPAGGVPRLRMHAAAHALMAYAPELGWSAMRPVLQVDNEFGREVFLTFPREVENRWANVWGKGFSTAVAGEVCLWMEGQFPRSEDPQRRSDGFHAVTPRDMVGDLRDALFGELVSRGTPESIVAIEHIQQSLPTRDFSSYMLRAKEAAAQGTWTPRSPREIIELRPLPASLFMNSMTASSPPSVITIVPPLMLATASPGASGARPSRALVTFPKPLLRDYEQNNLAVLFGSGLSLAHDVKGNFPLWNDLPKRLLDEVETYSTIPDDQIDALRGLVKSSPLMLDVMLGVLDVLKTALRLKYQDALRAIFRPRDAAPGDVHHALVELGIRVLATTNYDHLLEDAEGSRSRMTYTWMESTNALGDINAGGSVLFKIHGTANLEQTVVMTRSEYVRAAADISYQRVMSQLLQTRTFLLVGYGINDPHDLDLVFELNAKAFRSAAQTHYALMRDASSTDIYRWQNDFNVTVISYQDHADLPAILRQLRATKP